MDGMSWGGCWMEGGEEKRGGEEGLGGGENINYNKADKFKAA